MRFCDACKSFISSEASSYHHVYCNDELHCQAACSMPAAAAGQQGATGRRPHAVLRASEPMAAAASSFIFNKFKWLATMRVAGGPASHDGDGRAPASRCGSRCSAGCIPRGSCVRAGGARAHLLEVHGYRGYRYGACMAWRLAATRLPDNTSQCHDALHPPDLL